ncbi:MAG: hypothetical protein AAF732_12785 [Pseudomonadota bacterium]
MFERNPIDNVNAVTITVALTLTDGRVVSGRAAFDRQTSIHRLLDTADSFLYVENFNGDAEFIPKSDIRGVKVMKPIVPQPLRQPVGSDAELSPARILGVDDDADWDAIRT